MKKKNKQKINSGNTFWFGTNASYHRRNARYQHVIVKSVLGAESFDEASPVATKKVVAACSMYVDDGDLGHNEFDGRMRFIPYDVEYSMNKRKRWLLPGLIRDAVDEVKEDRTLESDENVISGSSRRHKPVAEQSTQRPWGDFNITMVERALSTTYQLYRRTILQNTCTGYHDSRQPLTHVTPRAKYSYEADLRAKAELQDKQRYERSERARRARIRHFLPDLDEPDDMDGVHGDILPGWIARAHPAGGQMNDNGGPLVTYEICHPAKLIPHKENYDDSHDNKFGIYGRNCHIRRRSWMKSHHKLKGHMKKFIRPVVASISDGLCGNVSICDDDTADVYSTCEHVEDTVQYTVLHTPSYHYDMVAAIDHALLDRQHVSSSNHYNNHCSKHHSKHHSKHRSRKSRKADRQTYNTYSRTDTHMAKNSTSGLRYGKGSYIYIDNPSPEQALTESDDDSATSEELSSFSEMRVDLRCKLEPYDIKLSRSETTRERLCEDFGRMYTEGHSLPRRFMLDLGQLLLQTVQHRLHSHKDIFLSSGLLLVIEELKCWQRCTSTKPFRLHVEGGLDLNHLLQIQQQIISLVSTQQHVVCLVTLTTILVDWLQDRDTLVNKLVSQGPPRKVSPVFMWPRNDQISSSHTAIEAYHMIGDPPIQEQTVSDTSSVRSSFLYLRTLSQVGHLDYCDICYDHLISHGDDGVDVSADFDGVAMETCEHWFCRQCWQSHLVSRIQRGDINIKCPDYGCDMPVDDVMFVSLLPYDYYQRHIDHLATARLERSPQWKWCPRAGCGRVGTLCYNGMSASVTDTAVMCRCGQVWCFSCQQDNHWPATCTQAGVYTKLLQQKNKREQENLIFQVDVKKCPFCRHPIEKAGGCQHMHCSRCRGDFCWVCLAAWRDHGNFLRCPKAAAAVETVEIDHEDNLRLDEVHMAQAVAYRKARITSLKVAVTDRIKELTFKSRCRLVRWSRQKGMCAAWSVFSEDVCPTYIQAWTFMIQGLYLLEQVHVVLSNCTRKQRTRGLLSDLYQFDFIIKKIQQAFSSKSGLDQDLERIVECGKQCSAAILWRVDITQRKMTKKKMTVTADNIKT